LKHRDTGCEEAFALAGLLILETDTAFSYFSRTASLLQNIANSLPAGEWEHIVVSNVKRFIPESVKQTWHEWRVSMKKAEHDIEGSNEVSDHVEMAGWGVEEADKANKSHASM
jgi:hypothetical protein